MMEVRVREFCPANGRFCRNEIHKSFLVPQLCFGGHPTCGRHSSVSRSTSFAHAPRRREERLRFNSGCAIPEGAMTISSIGSATRPADPSHLIGIRLKLDRVAPGGMEHNFAAHEVSLTNVKAGSFEIRPPKLSTWYVGTRVWSTGRASAHSATYDEGPRAAHDADHHLRCLFHGLTCRIAKSFRWVPSASKSAARIPAPPHLFGSPSHTFPHDPTSALLPRERCAKRRL